jgi:hypothetical protein
VTYPYAAYSWPSIERAGTYAAFVWPLVITAAAAALPALEAKAPLLALEVLFCLGSAWMLFVLTMFGELRYGAYVAFGSLGAYLAALIVELIGVLRRRFR